MGLEFISLASGSNGNCHLLISDKTKILVDAGMTGKYIAKSLAHLGLELGDIDAVLISHEHQDHINALGVIARRAGLDIYITEKTFHAAKNVIGKISLEQVHFIENNQPFMLGDIAVKPIPISHDAVDPVCYVLGQENKVAIVTDLGEVSDELLAELKTVELLLLEANHDYQMLINGVYPYPLKQRVLSDLGHLSNDACAEVALEIMAAGKLKVLILGHLSGENNRPDCAYHTVENKLLSAGYQVGRDYLLDISYRSFCGKLYRLG